MQKKERIAENGVNYRPQWTTYFTAWNNLTTNDLAGTGAELAYVDSQVPAGAALRLYRLTARRP